MKIKTCRCRTCTFFTSMKNNYVSLKHTFDNYVTHTIWSWMLVIISKFRNVIGSQFMRARLPGQMT